MKRITADDLIAVLEKAVDADAQLPTPESAGFATDAIRDFLTFVQVHGGFEVPTGPSSNAPVHHGSLMAGLVLGAVAAQSNEQRPGLRKTAHLLEREAADAYREAEVIAKERDAMNDKETIAANQLLGQYCYALDLEHSLREQAFTLRGAADILTLQEDSP